MTELYLDQLVKVAPGHKRGKDYIFAVRFTDNQ